MRKDTDFAGIPDHWTVRSLAEVCSMQSGGTPPKSDQTMWAGSMPWVSGKDLKSPRLRGAIDHITLEAAQEFSKIAPAGTVLVLVRGMGLANGFALSLIERPMAFNQDLKALIPKDGLLGAFLMHALTFAGTRMLRNVADAAHGTKRLSQDDLDTFKIPIPPIAEQQAIAAVLDRCRERIEVEIASEKTASALRRTAMTRLFTRGLRGRRQKDTEIGLLPADWDVVRLDSCANVISTRMSYSELEAVRPSSAHDAVPVLGIKVSDMNRPGNEVEISQAALVVPLDRSVAEHRCAPPGTIIFPKRGAAIATNKKRLATTWTVFDPNVIGVRSGANVNVRFLFHWFQNFDLRTITEPGPTPQLNKKNLDPLLVPVPAEMAEQCEIVTALDAVGRQISLSRQKRAVADGLYTCVLHKLMFGEIRVDHLDLSALADVAPLHQEASA